MDASEPPRIVFDAGTACADREGAEEALRHALERARAPKPGWVITTRIETTTTTELTAEVDVVDEQGTIFAQHTLPAAGTDCAGLARSAGEWASLALEAQVQHETAAPLPELPATAPAPVAPKAPALSPSALPASPTPVFEEPVEADEDSKLELGVGTFMLAGGGPGGDVGVSAFVIDNLGSDVFLRPSIALGKPMSSAQSSTWAAARLDTCRRLSGLYARGEGLELDLCGGADVGATYIASGADAGSPPSAITQPYIDIGPSVDLRAEAGRMVISLRGVGGYNVAHQGFEDATGVRVDPAIWSIRLEMDLSWKVRDSATASAR